MDFSKSTDKTRYFHFNRMSVLFVLFVMGVWTYCSYCSAAESEAKPGAAVLLIDTDRVTESVEKGVYGQFLEHINHSVVDGLYAEQIRDQGFEESNLRDYWRTFNQTGYVQHANNANFINGALSVRLVVNGGTTGVRQFRIYVQEGVTYNGSVWLKLEQGTVQAKLRINNNIGRPIISVPLEISGSEWQKVNYSFVCPQTDREAQVDITAEGNGSLLVDHLSLMRADDRANGMLRADLLKALADLKPPFIRWPGGSFASTYKWKDGIGPLELRTFHPNEMWGGYQDYYGFGTDEFLEMCKKLDTEPLIVLAATSTDPQEVQYAMDWVHYVNDPATTEWGKKRAANGHPEPYNVKYFQIDNEPMNHGHTPDQYAEIVNVYGSQIRKIAPDVKIVACGQKRSNDMVWSKKLIEIAGDNFDILGCHNYEYENENFQTGVQRIGDYLVKLREYIRISAHPNIKIAVLEWGLCRTYDWRAGLHTAGSLILYERMSPDLEMTCPALLMRNTTDNPEWRAFIYHDHVSWFPGSGYVVEKLFSEHYAPRRFDATMGVFRDIPNRKEFFDDISQMKPEDWTPGTVDAIATGTEDGKRIVVKAVNYADSRNVLLCRLQGSKAAEKGIVKVYTITAGLTDACSLEEPDKIKPVESTLEYSKDLTIKLEPYTVVLAEITME